MEESEVPAPQYFQTRNGRIAYWSFFTEEQTVPIVMVHGGPGDGCSPDKGEKMTVGHPVYMYDQLGCGESDPIPDIGKWGLDEYTSELREFIDGMGFDKVILIGASWGSALCVSYAKLTSCAKIVAMVLPSPYLSAEIWKDDSIKNVSEMSHTAYLQLMECLDAGDFGERYRAIMKDYYAKYLFTREVNRPIADAVAEAPLNDVFRALCGENDFECTGTLKGLDLTDYLPEIDVPVLFMCGDSDEVRMDTMQMYREYVPGSRLAVVPFAGHALSFEQFELYLSNILGFLIEIGQ
ncbi:putative hydrolases or acyltransferases (alpha/beta hydrolase superfamily) [Thermoplasmatales archaeon BRNA1]|nr:putative hydrolases or acyltransferases (alpha/beta hydrolase superfamily) [Thermoplasmatales archaeon BRNA1]